MDIQLKARLAEEIVSGDLVGRYGDDFTIPNAVAYSVTEHDEGVSVTFVQTSPDVYDLLADPNMFGVAKVSDYLLFVTTGWAAPIPNGENTDTPPSQHPERRRVRLTMFANRDEIASVLAFQDEPNDKIVTSEGEGNLAEAVNNLFVLADLFGSDN